MGFSPLAGASEAARPYLAVAAAVALGAGAAAGATAASASTGKSRVLRRLQDPSDRVAALYRSNTATPIKHLVVIFDENVSFDHYFGTYPYAANTDGTTFTAKPGTPTVNGLYTKITKTGPVGPLLTDNPNLYNPQRLTTPRPSPPTRTTATRRSSWPKTAARWTCSSRTPSPSTPTAGRAPEYCPPGIVMDYYDGNTVTALWNYAQYYSMSDNNWDTTFGPSTPGALNVISGDTRAPRP